MIGGRSCALSLAVLAVLSLGRAGRADAAKVAWDPTHVRVTVTAEAETLASVLETMSVTVPGLRVRWLRPDGSELVTVDLKEVELRTGLSRLLASRNHVITTVATNKDGTGIQVWVGSLLGDGTGSSTAAPIVARGPGGLQLPVAPQPIPQVPPGAQPPNPDPVVRLIQDAIAQGADPAQLQVLGESLGPEARALLMREMAERGAGRMQVGGGPNGMAGGSNGMPGGPNPMPGRPNQMLLPPGS